MTTHWIDKFQDEFERIDPNRGESEEDDDITTIVIETRDELIDTVVDTAERKQEKVKDVCCYFLEEDNLALRLKGFFKNYDIKLSISCLANTVSNSCNALLHLRNVEKRQNYVYNSLDAYLRSRHDLLHNLAITSLGLEILETDQAFCDIFPFMSSNRTPDRIIVEGMNVTIIETTATLNVLKGFITKGKIDEGFKSKYEKEIFELQNNEYFVEYYVLIFDVKDPQNNSYINDLKRLGLSLNKTLDEEKVMKCDMIRSVFCNYSEEIMKTFSIEISNLLTERFELEKVPTCVDFLMEEGHSKHKDYKRIGISTFVYNKISASWPRLPLILERCMLDYSGNISPCFDHSNGKFSFVKKRVGVSYDDLMNILMNDDKPTFSKILIQLLDGKVFNLDRADLEFFDVSKPELTPRYFSETLKQDCHLSSAIWIENGTLDNYDHLEIVDHYLNLHHKFEDPDYEDKLVDGLCDFFSSVDSCDAFHDYCKALGKKPFSSFNLTTSTITAAILKYDENLIEINRNQQNSNILRYQKQPFLYPLCNVENIDYIDYRTPPLKILNGLSGVNCGPYTRLILDKIQENFCWGSHNKDFNPEINDLSIKLRSFQNELYQRQLTYMRENNLKKIPKVRDLRRELDLNDVLNNISTVNKKLSSLGASSGLKNLSIIRLPSKGKTNPFREAFNEEMSHFRQKKSSSVYKGVGIIDFNRLFKDFSALKLEMKSVIDKDCPDNILHDHVANDVTLLKQLKIDYMQINVKKLNYIKSTNFYHSCAFVSRFCHTLAYLSQTSLSADYISVDNLGYDGVILMVRGGKKVFKTKQSKLFRLIYPIHESIKDWYQSGDYRSSVNLFNHNGVNYLLTPWHTLDEVVMNDGITFLHKSISYLLLSNDIDMAVAYDKCFFNVMLSFHNRRKTEELLHNVRYVCVNSIADISRLDLMLPELAGFNYDFFQAYIRSAISERFFNFSKALLDFNKVEKTGRNYFKNVNLEPIFDNYKIENLEDLTMTIYSTFLMSKSPTNQALEQVKNLKNMLKTYLIHQNESSDNVIEQYKMNAKIYTGDIQKYWNDLFDSDFNFDPSYCNLLGKFSADYLKNIITKGDLNAKWMKIVNENWDNFANTKGLRGMDDSNFFNKKGFFIVYEHILKNKLDHNAVKEILLSDADDFTKRKLISKYNLKYKDELGCKNMDCAVFHVVDKKQRGGSREIFVMDLQTKINQQAIEKFLAFMCKLIPNEAISVPSNRRLQHIHANVFEKFKQTDLETYNLTLDCRKWAPHSVINKFIDLIIGMSGFLPDTFLTHFLIFFAKMFNKKIYTREYVRDIMHSNEGMREKVEKILIHDQGKKGYYFNMSYSWIMGIFNYLSSFMHVMNQIHISHMILRVTNRSISTPCYYHMNAHSDDSGGKMQVDSQLSMMKTFYIYEMLLKSCNHLLSDKKCNISKKYFEFLSVLYINNVLLSLLAKISGAFSFHPTDNGYCGDINECYGKSIDLISNGASFEQAYVAMKVMSHLVFKFYFNRDPSISDYNLPPQLLGLPDAHPLIVMVSGSDSDIIRLTCDNEDYFNKLNYLSTRLNTDMDFTTDTIKPVKVQPNIKLSKDLITHVDILNSEEMDDNLVWIIKNSDIKNTGLMLFKYGLMLKDKKFSASLIDETITRRISRAYFFRSSNIVKTPWGDTSYKNLKMVLNCFLFDSDGVEMDEDWTMAIKGLKEEFEVFNNQEQSSFNLYEIMNSEVYLFSKSLNKISYGQDSIVDSKKTTKPIHLNMQKTSLPTSQNFNPSNLAIWIKMPEYRWLINLGDDYKNKYQQISLYLERHNINIDEIDVNWLHNLLRKLKTKYVKEYFIYSNLPHNFRDISTYKDFLGFLSHNSIKDKQILGITVPYGVSLSQPLNSVFKDMLNKNTTDLLTFLNYCFSIINDKNLFTEISGLKLNSSILGCKSDNLLEMLEELYKKWELELDNSKIVCPHIKSLISFCKGELNSAPWLQETYYYSFIKNQKMVGNVWLGKGILFINLPTMKMEFDILNTKITEIRATQNNYVFKHFEVAYINSVLLNANLGMLDDMFSKIDHSKWETVALGIDSSGSISINQNRHLRLSFQNFKSIRIIINKATRLSTSEVVINKNFSYDCISRHELHGDERCTLNVFKIEPQSMLELLMDLYDNDENRKIVESRGEIFKQYLTMFIGNASGVEMHLHIDELFDLFQSSRIYHIMSTLVEKDKLSKNTLKIRKHIYPGQEGGLLSALIDFKNLDEKFSFDYDRILNPEMMQLKSSQPEAFMSNLITNIKEKFDQLYSNIDKESIRRELIKLSDIMDNKKFHGKLLSLLTTWGYIGVMGSLEEMNFVKKQENYKTIRFRGENNIFSKFNERALKDFLAALAATVKSKNYFNDVSIIDNKANIFICKNWHDFQKTIISLVHTYVLNSFNIISKFLTHTPNMEFIKLSRTLEILLNDADFCVDLMTNMQNNPILMLIPVNNKSTNDIMIMLETLLNDFVHSKKQELNLNFKVAVQHNHELIQPYVITRDLLKETKMSFNLRNLYYHGITTKDEIKFFTQNKFHRVDDKLYNVNFSLGEFSELAIPFNKHFYIPNKLTEDAEESDEYYDITIEMESDEPDIDTLENIGEIVAEDYQRKVRLRYKNTISFMPHFEVKVFFLPDLKGKPNLLKFIRNSGTTLLLITNCYIDELIGNPDKRIKVFSKREQAWDNRMLLDPECQLYYLLDYHEIEDILWENILNAKIIEKSKLMTMNSAAPTNLIVIDDGTLKTVSKDMSLEDKMSLLEDMKAEDNDGDEECEKIVKIDEELPGIMIKLRNEGYDDDFVNLISSKLAKSSEMGFNEAINKMLSQFINSSKLMETIKMKTKKGSEDILTELEDVNQATKIFEVAEVFSTGIPNKSGFKNRSLKEPALRAEINSLYGNLTDLILSGTLSISRDELTTMIKFTKAMRRYAMAEKNDRDKKLFLIDLTHLIVNDAHLDKKGDHDYIFSSIRDKLTNKIVTDEEDDEYDFTTTYAKKSGLGRIYYKW